MLVIDDTESARQLIGLGLSFEDDFEVVAEAEDAASGVEVARRLQPDLVILDVEMPGQSGLEVLAQMRSVVPSSVILLYSAHQADVLDAARSNGADVVAEKGQSVSSLASTLREALSVRRGRP